MPKQHIHNPGISTSVCPDCQGSWKKPDPEGKEILCSNPDCINGRVARRGFKKKLAYLRKLYRKD
jgi:hypothetical protein